MAKPEEKSAEFNIPQLLKIISETTERIVNRQLKRLDMTSSQMLALGTIQAAGEPIPEKRLEEELHISQPSTVGLVRRMEGKGVISTSRSPEDGRSILLSLTPKGEEICREGEKDRHFGETLMAQGLSGEEKEQLHCLLSHVYKNLAMEEERGKRQK